MYKYYLLDVWLKFIQLEIFRLNEENYFCLWNLFVDKLDSKRVNFSYLQVFGKI